MTLLELLARATWTRVVTSWQLVLDDWIAWLLPSCVLLGCCSLVRIGQPFLIEVLLRLCILLALMLWFWSCLLHLLYFGDLCTCENGADAVVHLINHRIPHFSALKFKDEQGVFLLVAGVLYRVFQFVELSQVFFPGVINDVKQALRQAGALRINYSATNKEKIKN